jgi:hypothetical protein
VIARVATLAAAVIALTVLTVTTNEEFRAR